MKNTKKGITLIVLIITIIVGLILVSAGIVSVSSAISEATKTSFAEELKTIEDETSVYYLQNDEYPAKMNEAGDDFITYSPKEINELINDGNKFNKLTEEMKSNGEGEITSEVETKVVYALDLDKLPLDKKTRGIKKSDDDIYVVSANTNKVYYLKGVKTGGETYFSLSKLIKYVGQVSTASEGEVVVTKVGSLTVKRLKKTWTSKMGITLNVSDTTGDISAKLIAEGNEISSSNFTLQSSYTINKLEDIPGASFGNVSKFYSSKNKSIVFKKGTDELEVDLSNYDIQAPTYDDPNTWNITQTNEDNVISFNVEDDISGVKEIRYAYLTKYTGNGDNCGIEYYYNGVESLDASFIKARGKKATISKDGDAVLKVPRDIEGIQLVVIDKAGNYPVELDEKPIRYGIKKDYVGCKLESISNAGLTFYSLFNSEQTGNYISEYKVSISTDGKNYTTPITKTTTGNPQNLKELVDDYKENLNITDKVYVKIEGTFKNTTDTNVEDIQERIFEFSVNDVASDVTVKEVPTVGETFTLSVENPKDGATYYWTDLESTFKRDGADLVLNEAEVVAYEGKSLYYLEELNGVKTASKLYIYRVNYNISKPEQMVGIYKMTSGNVKYSENGEEKIQYLEGKTISMLNDLEVNLDSPSYNWPKITTFKGIFDGNNKVLKSKYYVFGTNDGTIKNLVRKYDQIIKPSSSANESEAYAAVCSTNNGIIENCTSDLTGITISTWGEGTLGGIARYNYGTIKGCINRTDISNGEQTINGGICGSNFGIIDNCINYGKVVMIDTNGGTNAIPSAVAGIAGNNGSFTISDAKVMNCKNLGDLTIDGNGGTRSAGGICGIGAGYIMNSGNLGSIQFNSSSTMGGGICGHSYMTWGQDYNSSNPAQLYIYNCYNVGKISGNFSVYGEILGRIKSGSVYIKNSYSLGSKYLVGAKGSYEKEGTQTRTIENCYVLSDGNNDLSDTNSPFTFKNFYTLGTGTPASGITYVTDAEMKTEAFCNKLNNNQLSDSGEPIFKMIKEQDYPALYWQEGTTK